jgi:hypothetical protein
MKGRTHLLRWGTQIERGIDGGRLLLVDTTRTWAGRRLGRIANHSAVVKFAARLYHVRRYVFVPRNAIPTHQ